MQPLRGIRVLDLSRLLPGPYASMVLSDLGASVDKIEDPMGDYLRHMPPHKEGESVMFASVNRDKRSGCFDLKKPAAQRALRRLAAGYDVLLEQFRPGVMARLGLPIHELRADYPRLIVCSLTGYGQTGPLSQRAGHDINFMARSGLLGLQGPSDGKPALPGFQLADTAGALWSAIAILAALRERDRTGFGQHLDIAMVDAAAGFAAMSMAESLSGFGMPRGTSALTGGTCLYGTYETKDGRYVAFAALEPKFYLSFCAGCGIEPRADALLPGDHQTQLRASLDLLFRTRTRDEWAAFAEKFDCCLEPVLDPSELRSDPHHLARVNVLEVGGVKVLRTPLHSGESRPRAPARLGANTAEILGEGGFTEEEIAELRAELAIS